MQKNLFIILWIIMRNCKKRKDQLNLRDIKKKNKNQIVKMMKNKMYF